MNYNKRKNITSQKMIAEINVTPFVDVILVLLIIFMITTPLLSSGVDVNLPTGANKPLTIKPNSTTVTIKKDGEIFLNENEVSFEKLSESISKIAKKSDNIIIKGDKKISYADLMTIIGKLSDEGYKNLSLQSSPKNNL